jgi:solute carrier family 25 (mitochondrial carnitine/acylcarnitine transporter), member 20/29
LDGSDIQIIVTPEKTRVNHTDLLQPDIYASNGVLHLVEDLLTTLEMTPEKYLIAKNCSSFVRLLNSTDLRFLVNDTTSEYTILAPTDDVLTVFGNDNIPDPGTEELAKMLRYHFLPGRWTQKRLQGTMLLETALIEEGLQGKPQVLSVQASDKQKKSLSKSISFGGASSLGDPREFYI